MTTVNILHAASEVMRHAQPTPSESNNTLITSVLRFNTQRARLALMAVLMLLTAATGWAQTSGYWNDWVEENNIDWSSADAKAAAIPQSDDGSTVYISTAEQLAYYAYAVNNDKQISGWASGYYCGRTVELMADIDLSAHYWKPIGWNKSYYFNGYFHGNGHVITGMHVNGDPKSDIIGNIPCYGLFGYLHTRTGGTSTITDLVLKDFSITASFSGNIADVFYLGGLVGRCDDNTAITNCLLVNGSVSKYLNNTSAHIGKVAGGGSPSTATANYYHNVSVSGWMSKTAEHYSQQTIGGETEARAVALTISGTHGSVALGGTVGRISGGIIYAPANETVTLNTTTDAGYIASLAATGLTLTNGQFTMPDNDAAAIAATFTPDPAHFSVNAAGTEYTIHTATGWGVFCDCLDDNDTYNRFSGKIVKLGANIGTAENPITRWAGSDGHEFQGNFDGGGNTLTFTVTTATDNYCAPFRNVKGGSDEDHAITISNLNVKTTITATDYRHTAGLIALQWGHVNVSGCNATVNISSTVGDNNPHDLYPAALVSQASSSDGGTLTVTGCTATGTISTDGKYAAGLVGIVQGAASISDCVSSVTINSSIKGDGTHGGIVAVVTGSGTITGCVFNGKLLTVNTGETATGNCAGFVAWGNGTISNCLYAPAAIEGDEAEVVAGTGDYPSGTFYRGTAPTVTNCYYTRALGTAQGKAPHTVTPGDNVTVEDIALTGTTTQYTVSGITAYSGGGLQRGQTLYYGSGDQLSLTLSNSATAAPLGYQYAYTASAGTLSGTTLTMPDQDVTISAALAPIDWATVNQGTSKDPYMIYNKDQLLLLAHRVNGTNDETANTYQGKYFKLGADITFTHPADETDDYDENYEAIGGYIGGINRYFKGDFDGANHTVSGIRTRKTGSGAANSYQGLFGCIGSGADIHDVHLTDARFTGYDCVGGIAGCNEDGYISGCSVTDSYITATRNWNYGTICGCTTNTYRLIKNYYHGCTVNGTAVTTGMGCGGSKIADLTDNHGALPAYAIALGANITTPPGTFAGQTGWLTTPPVDARLAPGNGFTLAGNHYFASGYVFTPGSTLASGAAQGYTPRATLGGQLLDPYTPTGDADPLAGTAIAQFTVTADCDGKTLASTQAIYSTGQPVTVAYINADGNAGEASAIALDGTETSLAAGTYFAGLENVNFDHTVTLTGNVTLILADNCHMNVGTSGNRISGNGIARENDGDQALTIYGQNAGTGALNVYTGNGNNGIVAKAVTINGGNVTTDANEKWSAGIFVRDDIIINGGTVNATATGNNTWGLYANRNLTINGGNVNATGGANGIRATANVAINGGNVTATGGTYGIRADNGTITLGWSKPTDRITASSYYGTVSVKDGLAFVTDEATPAVIGGTISDLAAINGKTLKPATFYLVGNMTNPEWTVNADYQLTVNPGNTSELMIQNVPLTGSTEFKVVYSANGTEATTWYPGDGYNYWISADGIYDIYFRPDYQGGDDWHYGCIYATDVSNIEVAFAPEGFATYYHGTFDVKLPEGVKARIVTARGDSEGTLTYQTIADGDNSDGNVVPAGTAVMLQTEKSTEAQQKTLTLAVHGADSPAAPTLNLLHGSDVEGTTTGDGKHYKLTYGNDNTPNADVFGWYWGAADGAAFTQAGHKAWLVLPADANARSFFGLPDDDTTSIIENGKLKIENSNADAWYDLSGRKLDNGQRSMVNGQWSKGIYIRGGKKVVIK